MPINNKYCVDCKHVIDKGEALFGIRYYCNATLDLVTGEPVVCEAIRATTTGADCPDYESKNRPND